MITEVAYGPMDIGGHQQDRIFAYVVPGQSDNLILGQKWMEDQDVELSPRNGYLTIKSTGVHIWNSNLSKRGNTNAQLTQVSSSIFIGLVHHAQKELDSSTEVFAASLKDIEKSLTVKK
jgi:hypothetical protein